MGKIVISVKIISGCGKWHDYILVKRINGVKKQSDEIIHCEVKTWKVWEAKRPAEKGFKTTTFYYT